jgi:hypothetical protein
MGDTGMIILGITTPEVGTEEVDEAGKPEFQVAAVFALMSCPCCCCS